MSLTKRTGPIVTEMSSIPTAIAKKYREKFVEIAIDEYQDSNLLQEYILTSISRGNNIFMVGDVKQSIYKFRQAMPELFLSKYKQYDAYQKSLVSITTEVTKRTGPNVTRRTKRTGPNVTNVFKWQKNSII